MVLQEALDGVTDLVLYSQVRPLLGRQVVPVISGGMGHPQIGA